MWTTIRFKSCDTIIKTLTSTNYVTHTANNVHNIHSINIGCLFNNFIAATKTDCMAGMLLLFADTLHAQQLSNKLGTAAELYISINDSMLPSVCYIVNYMARVGVRVGLGVHIAYGW